MNKKQIKMVVIDQSNIDDVFIYKHKIEDEIAKETDSEVTRMKIDEFINSYLHLSDCVFSCSRTKEAVAFSIKKIGDEIVCFHTKTSDITMKTFLDKMNEIDWDIKKMSSQTVVSVHEDINNIDFFLIGTEMKTV